LRVFSIRCTNEAAQLVLNKVQCPLMDIFTRLTPAILKTTKDYIAALEAIEIMTVGDLLRYLPRDY
jgi:hypothetical protein